MTANTLNVTGEIIGIVLGAAFMLLFGIAIALPYVPWQQAARRGHRQTEHGEAQHEGFRRRQRGEPSPEDVEIIKPDGYIDSFAGEIEEAGGGLPPVVWVVIVTILIAYVAYAIIFWAPRGFPYLQ